MNSDRALSGRGPVQVAFRGDAVLVRIDAATTQTRRLKKLLNTNCRREIGARRPTYSPFEVRIWTSVIESARAAHDVDNVAKACLDALSGILWRDDRQVARLISERFQGSANQIAILAAPLAGPLPAVSLDETLFERCWR